MQTVCELDREEHVAARVGCLQSPVIPFDHLSTRFRAEFRDGFESLSPGLIQIPYFDALIVDYRLIVAD